MARIRFRPPRRTPTEELVWLLRAAFADDVPNPVEAGRADATLDLADRLSLTAPIGARLRRPGWSRLLNEAMAERFRRAHAQSAIRAVMHDRIARQIAEIASNTSIAVTFLKGFALFLGGRDRAGGRLIGDLDILVPEDRAGVLHAALRRSGYQAKGEAGNEHHLATLVSPEGGNIDLHFRIRDLSLRGTAWATWGALAELDLLVPAEGYPENCTLPTTAVQAAHVLVHGLAHHVWRPHTYPMLRMVSDMNELLPAEPAWREFLNSYRPILLRSIPGPELDAMRGLALGLRGGQIPDLETPRASNEAILLRHILSGYLDPDYGPRLWLRHTLGRLSDAARQGRLWSYLARKTGR